MKIKILIIACGITFLSNSIFAQYLKDPKAQKNLEEQIKSAEETGYADIEFDLLHKKITDLLPLLKDYISKDNKENSNAIVIEIASGETYKSPIERFLFNGTIHLYLNGSSDKISKIKLIYDKVDPDKYSFLGQRREITNPTPNFFDNNSSIDKNDDLVVTYYEQTANNNEYNKIKEITIKEVPFFEKRLVILESYKKYLRKAYWALQKKIYDNELTEKAEIRYLLELE
ncbi:MAG: hypothetical protein OEZ22_03105 [Spirochaetia bacterium]|nr:hypothetical protein [Spirochaetia bacterium]